MVFHGEIQGKGRWTRYAAWVLRIIVGLVILIAVVGHFWFVPAKFRCEIKKSLMKFWHGQVDIEDVEVNYFGPIYLGKVRFFDSFGRECLHTGRVKMIFTKWPGVHPLLTKIEIEKLNVQLPMPADRVTLPVAYPAKKPPGSKKRFDIRTFIINDAEINIADTQGLESLYDNLQLLVTKQDDFYDFSLFRDDSMSSESLSAKGRVYSKTLEAELSLQMKHMVKKSETALILSALSAHEFSAGGSLMADLTITGCLKRPAGLKPKGTINLNGWTVAKDDKILAKDLAARVNANNMRCDFESITATVFNGGAIGSLFIERRNNNPAVFSGQILTRGMDFVELTSVIGGPGRRATRGSVAFSYNFAGEGTDLQNLVGLGRIFLDDADITVIPVVPHIFRFIGLSRLNPLEMSDAGCTFTTAGPVVAVETAHVANFFAAVKAEPGGTINLQTKQIDIYVVALPIKQIDAVIGRIPILNIFVNLKDKLVRFRIRGYWSDSPAKLFTKEPIKDIEKATVGFFRDVIETGDWITQPIRKGLSIFSEPEDNGNQPNN
ncbi:MAG: hypothetical protein JW947_08315 [Sedimentisphaerales bacterium]|nr:hypothetical protein [Sedimentisphaerales bacterium]